MEVYIFHTECLNFWYREFMFLLQKAINIENWKQIISREYLYLWHRKQLIQKIVY